MGPISAKTYPGTEWQQGPRRATFEPDYGRRGKLWVHGAFEPATGKAAILTSARRDSARHIRLLEKMTEAFPSDRWLVIEDNLSTHVSRETRLALTAWPEIRLQPLPKYAPWLNTDRYGPVEPWWKQLRSLALKGRRFESAQQIEEALYAALEYWNARRHPYTWKKHPQEQALLAEAPLGGLGVTCRTPLNDLTRRPLS